MARELSPWMRGDDGTEVFPYLRRRGGVAIIGLCTGVPTLPFVASGKLGSEQLARLEQMLQRNARRHPGGADCTIRRSMAAAASAISATIAPWRKSSRREGAELVLHGHSHSISRKSMHGPKGPIPVLGICSASSIGRNPRRRAAYYLIDIDAGIRRLGITARQLGAAGQFHVLSAD